MPDPQRRLILANGEQYVVSESKPTSGRPTEPPRSFDDARSLVKDGVVTSLDQFKSLPPQKRIPGEAVFCLRLHPDAMAKSYDPVALFDEVPELSSVGSRNYRIDTATVAQTKRTKKKASAGEDTLEGRMIFVRSTPAGYQRLMDRLDAPESSLSQQFKNEIRRVERFSAISVSEQILGFEPKWQEGRVELVLHPSRGAPDGQLNFLFELFDYCGIDIQRSRVRQYAFGPAFASCYITRQVLNVIAGTNPLRSAHPLTFGGFEDLRNAPAFSAPHPPASATRSTIKVGMFDGGIDPSNPLLAGHAEEDIALSINNRPLDEYVDHGTAVAGALGQRIK